MRLQVLLVFISESPLFQVSEDLNSHFKEHLEALSKKNLSNVISIKILNQGAWARTYERQPVSLPRELEDFIPEVEDFYKVTLRLKN